MDFYLIVCRYVTKIVLIALGSSGRERKWGENRGDQRSAIAEERRVDIS